VSKEYLVNFLEGYCENELDKRSMKNLRNKKDPVYAGIKKMEDVDAKYRKYVKQLIGRAGTE